MFKIHNRNKHTILMIGYNHFAYIFITHQPLYMTQLGLRVRLRAS